MCGILGAFGRGGWTPDRGQFERALDLLRRRGPDDLGVWRDSYVQLGHRRLAIVDLSPTGRQPMESADGRLVIVFNGEIYNHEALRAQLTPPGGWRGTSDTETLLEAYRAWGPGCLERLNGMFAFAVWDRLDRRLFLARDRLGVKPLYYAALCERFLFASRPRALAALLEPSGRDIDWQALRLYLELGHIPAPFSLYRGIRKLRPGHYACVDERGLRVVRYWDYRHIPVEEHLVTRDEDELAEELDELVRSAVRIRLMSDVPLGAFLSGGVDSALVVASMKAAGVTAPKAFTIGFHESAYDESAAAARIAAHLGVEHVHEKLSVDGLLDLLPSYIEEFDEPLADSAAFPNMAVARLARRHVTVALSGDAGDELFGGYHYYGLLERLGPITAWPESARRMAHRAVRAWPSHRAKLLAGALRFDDRIALFHYMRSVGKDFETLLSTDALVGTQSSADLFAEAAASFPTDLRAAEIGMRLDVGFVLPDCYLQKVDLATMAFSLEGRCPLTDYRLVEWAMRLPLRFKLQGGGTKHLLKKALCRHLPRELVYRPKMGFVVPVADWLRGPLKTWAQELVADTGTMSRLPLERSRVASLLRSHVRGERNAYPMLWGVLMLLCVVAHQASGARSASGPALRAA